MTYQELKEYHQKRFNELKRCLKKPRITKRTNIQKCCKYIMKTEKDFLEAVLKDWPKPSR